MMLDRFSGSIYLCFGAFGLRVWKYKDVSGLWFEYDLEKTGFKLVKRG
jgi:hypothetical protein